MIELFGIPLFAISVIANLRLPLVAVLTLLVMMISLLAAMVITFLPAPF